jgi:hypothetical protein
VKKRGANRTPAIGKRVNCPGYTNLTDLSGCLAPAVLSSISCPSCSVQAFSSLLSCASLLVPSTFVPKVLSLLTCSDRPILSVLSCIFPVLAVLPQLSFLLSCPGFPELSLQGLLKTEELIINYNYYNNIIIIYIII